MYKHKKIYEDLFLSDNQIQEKIDSLIDSTPIYTHEEFK